jgi:alpha-mannosidase
VQRIEELLSVPLPGWRFHGDMPHGESAQVDDARWPAAEPDKHFPERGWFRAWVEVPAKSKGGYALADCRAWLDVKIDGVGSVPVAVFVDGIERYQFWDGISAEPILLTEHARPGQRHLIAVRAMAGRRDPVPALDTWFVSARLTFDRPAGRPDPLAIGRELAAASELASAPALSHGDQARRGRAEAAIAAIDWTALARDDQKKFDDSLRAAEARLRPLGEWLRGLSVQTLGNSHMDLAWLWPWTETVDVVHNTFATVLQLMREYPEFKFAQSTAQYYEWMEEKYPALFDEIKQRVREGRWEVVGGMWVESDLNMPDGESIVRQLLYGKRYFKDKLGVDVKVGWCPDSFGFTRQLPQILRRAGVDSFLTQKLDWNDTTPFPHRVFWWEGPDGSRVLTYFPHRYDNPIDPIHIAHDLALHAPASGTPEILYLYGVGDHGGGPTRQMLDAARGLGAAGTPFPTLTSTTAREFFERTRRREAHGARFPVWKDELYLQYHRGVYTTQASTKRGNRRTEDLLATAETFSTLAWLWGLPYPSEDLAGAWKKLLVNQFHDILSGSGVSGLYIEAARDHAEAQRAAREALSRALAHLSSQVDTRGPGTPAIVFNGLGWPRGGLVTVETPPFLKGGDLQVLGPDGKAVPSELLPATESRPARVRFVADAVPAVGYKVFQLKSGNGPAATALAAHDDTLSIENESLRVHVDPATGCLTIFDKRAARDVFPAGTCANRLQAFGDHPKRFDAWNIDAEFENERLEIGAPTSVKVVEHGPLRVAVRVVTRWKSSTFRQDFVLVPGGDRVDVETEIDWRERHTLLKAAFPVGGKPERATFEVPYGTIDRPARRRTPEERAMFEVPALRWADLTDGSYGLSVLNDSKYGYDARDGVLRLTLLRSPTDPDATADLRRHEFTYSLYPHAGDWRRAATMRHGYELNRPLVAIVTSPHPGSLPAAHGFVTLEPANVAIASIKKAEDPDKDAGADGRSLVVRFYEYEGRGADARLSLPLPPARASESSLLEVAERPLALRGSAVAVPTRPYEIKTVRALVREATLPRR